MDEEPEACDECGYQCTSSKECVENQELIDLSQDEEED